MDTEKTDRNKLHSRATCTIPPSIFCFHCNALIVSPLPFHFNLTSISHPFFPLFSLSPFGLSLCFCITLFGLVHLADIVNSHCFSNPEVIPWPGCTIRSSLLANTQTRRQTKTVCLFCCVLLASIILYLFLPRHFFFSLLSSYPLLQYIFYMVYNEPARAMKN